MSDAYTRNCRDCNRPIMMADTVNGWQPFELDGSGRHYCGTPAPVEVVYTAPFNDFSEKVTRPTRCWWCDEPVYFHSNGNGDAVLLDALTGAPWPVHPCWEQHKSDKPRVYKQITEDKRIHKPRPEWRSIKPLKAQPSSENIQTLSGCVVKPFSAHEDEFEYLPNDHKKLIVSHGQKASYVIITPEIYSHIPDESLIEVDVIFLKDPNGLQVPVAKKLRFEDKGKARIKRMLKRNTLGNCDYCGASSKKGFAINALWHVECKNCRSLRGELAPNTFLSEIRKISAHFFKSDFPGKKKVHKT